MNLKEFNALIENKELAQAKNKREEATYSSKYKFDKKTVEELKLKAILFINKAKEII